ncbi:MAG: shikimate kinase [Planctomycetia bacterium]
MPRITLIGYRGCGKSTVAERLAARLGCGWQDADTVLEEEVGCTIADLVRGRGEPFFRDVEAALLAGQLSSYDGVLATGGGVVLRPANRIVLRQAYRPVVWLTAPVDVVRSRLAADPTTAARRPALSGSDPLEEVAAAIAAREPLYRECADHVIDTSRAGSDAVAEAIDAWLKREWSS